MAPSLTFQFTVSSTDQAMDWCRQCGCSLSLAAADPAQAASLPQGVNAETVLPSPTTTCVTPLSDSGSTASNGNSGGSGGSSSTPRLFPVFASAVPPAPPPPPPQASASNASSPSPLLTEVSLEANSTAKWGAVVPSGGTYALRLTLGTGCVLGDWIVAVDTQGPRASGLVQAASATSVNWVWGPAEPVRAAKDSNRMLLLVTLNFSTPVVDFAMGAVFVTNAELLEFGSNDNKTFFVWALGTAGDTCLFQLPASSYHDVYGRRGQDDVLLTLSVPKEDDSLQTAGQAVSVVTSVAWGTTAVGAVMSFHSGGLMQCAYHIQLLAMSANLASPGVLEQYRKVARYFRWSLLAVKGYLPFLDSSFQDPAPPAPASPPTRSTTTATNTSSPTPSPIASNPYDPTTASKRRGLLAGQALQSAWPPPPGPSGVPNPPVPPGPPAPPAPPPGWQYSSGPVQSNPERSETQDTAYTLTVAALLFGVVLVLHALVYLGYSVVSGTPPALVASPFPEVSFGALLLMGIAFYASLRLGTNASDLAVQQPSDLLPATTTTTTTSFPAAAFPPPAPFATGATSATGRLLLGSDAGGSDGATGGSGFSQSPDLAILALALLVGAFALFLWWLTLCRLVVGTSHLLLPAEQCAPLQEEEQEDMLQHTNPLAAEPRLSRRSLDQGQSGADAEVPSRAHSHHSHAASRHDAGPEDSNHEDSDRNSASSTDSERLGPHWVRRPTNAQLKRVSVYTGRVWTAPEDRGLSIIGAATGGGAHEAAIDGADVELHSVRMARRQTDEQKQAAAGNAEFPDFTRRPLPQLQDGVHAPRHGSEADRKADGEGTQRSGGEIHALGDNGMHAGGRVPGAERLPEGPHWHTRPGHLAQDRPERQGANGMSSGADTHAGAGTEGERRVGGAKGAAATRARDGFNGLSAGADVRAREAGPEEVGGARVARPKAAVGRERGMGMNSVSAGGETRAREAGPEEPSRPVGAARARNKPVARAERGMGMNSVSAGAETRARERGPEDGGTSRLGGSEEPVAKPPRRRAAREADPASQLMFNASATDDNIETLEGSDDDEDEQEAAKKVTPPGGLKPAGTRPDAVGVASAAAGGVVVMPSFSKASVLSSTSSGAGSDRLVSASEAVLTWQYPSIADRHGTVGTLGDAGPSGAAVDGMGSSSSGPPGMHSAGARKAMPGSGGPGSGRGVPGASVPPPPPLASLPLPLTSQDSAAPAKLIRLSGLVPATGEEEDVHLKGLAPTPSRQLPLPPLPPAPPPCAPPPLALNPGLVPDSMLESPQGRGSSGSVVQWLRDTLLGRGGMAIGEATEAWQDTTEPEPQAPPPQPQQQQGGASQRLATARSLQRPSIVPEEEDDEEEDGVAEPLQPAIKSPFARAATGLSATPKRGAAGMHTSGGGTAPGAGEGRTALMRSNTGSGAAESAATAAGSKWASNRREVVAAGDAARSALGVGQARGGARKAVTGSVDSGIAQAGRLGSPPPPSAAKGHGGAYTTRMRRSTTEPSGMAAGGAIARYPVSDVPPAAAVLKTKEDAGGSSSGSALLSLGSGPLITSSPAKAPAAPAALSRLGSGLIASKKKKAVVPVNTAPLQGSARRSWWDKPQPAAAAGAADAADTSRTSPESASSEHAHGSASTHASGSAHGSGSAQASAPGSAASGASLSDARASAAPPAPQHAQHGLQGQQGAQSSWVGQRGSYGGAEGAGPNGGLAGMLPLPGLPPSPPQTPRLATVDASRMVFPSLAAEAGKLSSSAGPAPGSKAPSAGHSQGKLQGSAALPARPLSPPASSRTQSSRTSQQGSPTADEAGADAPTFHLDSLRSSGDAASPSPSPSMERPLSIPAGAAAAPMVGRGEGAQAPVALGAPTDSRWRAWVARRANWLLPSPGVMRRFEFVFDDVTGPTPETKAERSQWYRIIATALNFTHKTMCAAVLGGFGLQLLSWGQLAALLCLQLFMIAYLLAARPYYQWQLAALELAAHTFHAVMVMLAMGLVGCSQCVASNWGMLTLLLAVVTAVLLYEAWSIYMMVCAALAWWKARREAAAAAKKTLELQGDGVEANRPGRD